MFKRIAAILLLLAFSAQTFSSPFFLLDYYMNTTVYAKNCINKAKPKMHCNGHCQVMKKMQEEEKKEQQNAGRKTENKLQVLSSRSFFGCLPPVRLVILEQTRKEKQYSLADMAYSFFHPPQQS